jgi:hypothetical protein
VVVIAGRGSPEGEPEPSASESESPAAQEEGKVLPKITGFAPNSGPVGTAVTITGSGFTEVTAVTIGNVAAAVTAQSDTSLTVVVPGRAVTGRIRLASEAGVVTSTSVFTVEAASGSPVPTESPTPTPTPTPMVSATLGFSAEAYTVDEDDGPATITVNRSANTDNDVTVRYDTSGGSAQGNDYVHTSGMLTFAAGVTSRTFTIQIYDDGESESDETVMLRLSDVSDGATLGVSAATLTIVDDESQTL